MIGKLLAAAVLLGLVGVAHGEEPAKARWIVVAAPGLRDAVEPLIKLRKAEGMEVFVARSGEGQKGAETIREGIAALLKEWKGTSYVLLVGAAKAAPGEDETQMVVPPLVGTIGRMKGEPSDNGYGMPAEKDVMPTVAVGRLPAHSAKELREKVAAIIDAEASMPLADHRNAIGLIIGDPGGRDEAERELAAQAVTGQFQKMMQRVHPAWSTKALIDVKDSPWGVPADRLRETAKAVARSGMLTVYAGHSGADGMYSQRRALMMREDWASIDCHLSVFVSCGCFGMQYQDSRNGKGEGYAIAALRNPRGPVAAIGGDRGELRDGGAVGV